MTVTPASLWHDAPNMLLLILLYMLQGLPLGLSTGSLSILLRDHTTLTQIGLFSLSSYPYSLKLFYSPIIDSLYPKGQNSMGRRRTWIVPLQVLLGALFIATADQAQAWVTEGEVWRLTQLFFGLVLLAASQDVAVDGWALEILDRSNLAYASTCQTIGMNLGYSLSFPIFLALNDAVFSDKVRGFLRLAAHPGAPLLDLASFMRLCGYLFLLITAVVLLKPEPVEPGQDESKSAWEEIAEAYRQLWSVVRLRSIHKLALLLLTFRLGTTLVEGMLSLKLMEKGVSQDSLAALVLIQTPLEFVVAVIAGSWTRSSGFSQPWIYGWLIRLVTGALMTALIFSWPDRALAADKHVASPWYLALQVLGALTSLASTVQFTAQGAFFSRIADPSIGGAYLTLLNTVSNVGSTAYRPFLYAAVDRLTVRKCRAAEGEPALKDLALLNARCTTAEHDPCKEAGGHCMAELDGFYLLSCALMLLAVVLLPVYIRLVTFVEKVPEEKWKVSLPAAKREEDKPVAKAKGSEKAEGTGTRSRNDRKDWVELF